MGIEDKGRRASYRPADGLYAGAFAPETLFGEEPMIIAEIYNQTVHTVTQSGIGLGSAIAVVCSWQRNRSIVYAIIAGVFSWLYVIYFAVTREPGETK